MTSIRVASTITARVAGPNREVRVVSTGPAVRMNAGSIVVVGNVDPDAIAEAVEDYLTANPPSGLPTPTGADGQVIIARSGSATWDDIEISDVVGLQDALDAAGGGDAADFVAYAIDPTTPVNGSATTVRFYDSRTSASLGSPVPVAFLVGGDPVFRPGVSDANVYQVTNVGAWTVVDTLTGGQTIFSPIQNLRYVGTNLTDPFAVGTDHDDVATTILLEVPFTDVSAIESDVSDLTSDVSDLTSDLNGVLTRLSRYYPQPPSNPVTPHLHRSKYVTWDPDFPLDGSATHVGGNAIEDGQNITIADDSSGNGGVHTLHLGSAATTPTGFGSMIAADIGNYDLVSFTGTLWAAETTWRLYGNVTTFGLDTIFAAEPQDKLFTPTLIASDLTGDNLTVYNSDGTTEVLSVAALTDTLCVLVLDDGSLVTIDDGTVVMTENFAGAHDSLWLSRGVGGDHGGVLVTLSSGVWDVLNSAGGGGGLPAGGIVTVSTADTPVSNSARILLINLATSGNVPMVDGNPYDITAINIGTGTGTIKFDGAAICAVAPGETWSVRNGSPGDWWAWKEDPTSTATGDVVGPSSSTDGRAVEFDGTTGKLLKQANLTGPYGRPRLDADGTWADILMPSSIARDSEVAAAITAHAGATDPHGDRAYTDTALSTKADLVGGTVPSAQLPSYVDDVLEYANLAAFPAAGEAGKIYVAVDTNLTYRWTGSTYGVLDPSLALGETSSTAYRGDRGKTAYDHSQAAGNPHGTAVTDLANIATARFVGRTTSGTGAPELLTAAQMRTALAVLTDGLFGTGADGDVTIAANTSITSDLTNGVKNYRNLTINSGVTLTLPGGIIFVSDTLTLTGTISANGNNGASNAAGATVGGPFVAGTALNGGANGANSGAGTQGAPTANPTGGQVVIGGGRGGSGGTANSGGTAGGTAGALASLTSISDAGWRSHLPSILTAMVQSRAIPLQVTGGGTGGGGGAGSGGIGGGGGSGGGCVIIVARHVSGSGTISANGGNGGNAFSGNSGGGGGGGGGFVVLFTGDSSSSITLTAAAGTGGTALGTGANGVNGSAGNTLTIVGAA